MNPNNLIVYVIIRLIDSSWYWRGKHTWQALIGNFLLQEVADECKHMNWGAFKPLLTDALIDHLHPIQVCAFLLQLFFFSNYHTHTIHFGFVYKYEISFALLMEIGEVAEVNILSSHL